MNFKKLIVESGKRMEGAGLTVETWGNISVRDPETNLVYLTPSGMKYSTIVEDDVVVCDLEGNIVEGTRKPTIEKELHCLIYQARPEVNAIVHTHPMYSMVYATQGKDIPLIIDEAAQTLGDTCRCPAYALPGSHELAAGCVEALGKKANACLIHSHGAVCLGADMDGAFKTAKVLEVTAQIYYMVEATGGKPVGISPENIAFMQDFVKNSYGQGK
jgi:L-fuculose-phosphate aldolase